MEFKELPQIEFNDRYPVVEQTGLVKKGNYRFLLIGSGFSARFCPGLIYENFWENVDEGRYARLLKLNSLFGTNNIESILHKLKTSKMIMKYLYKQYYNKIEELESELKSCFYETIDNICQHSDVKPYFYSIGRFLTTFDAIFSLNYDPILYWSLLEYEKRIGQRYAFCDYMQKSQNNWRIFKKESEVVSRGISQRDCTFIYYLHGSLFFAINEKGETMKSTYREPQVSTMRDQIIESRHDMLMVMEGNYEDKKSRIDENEYLKFCLEKLSGITKDYNGEKNDLCILGFSANFKTDKHIIDAICQNKNIDVCLCIYDDERRNNTIPHNNGLDVSRYHDFIKELTKNDIKNIELYDVTNKGSLICDEKDA